MMHRVIFIICIFTTLLFSQDKLQKVSIQLNWKHQFEFAGYYIAKEKGFYKKAGLSVDIKEFSNGVDVVDDVLKGKSTFGIGYPTLTLDRARNNEVVLLSSIFQISPYVLVTLKSSGINSVKDFKNKKIMLGTNNAADNASFLSMFSANGLKPSEMTRVKNSFDITKLINKKVDIFAGFTSNELYKLDTLGIKYNTWDPKDYGFDFYDGIIFTSQKEIEKNPNIVKNFTKASIRGWVYAFNHINETVNLILKKYNTQQKTKKALLYEATALKKLAYYQTQQLRLHQFLLL